MIELSVEGKKQVVDIGDLIKGACSLIINKVGNAIKSIVASADPEYQPVLRNNIILSGGGSLIDGIADAIANEIADIGDVTVTCVEDPIDKVALGAMALAQICLMNNTPLSIKGRIIGVFYPFTNERLNNG